MMSKDEALHKALKVLNCLNNDRVYEAAWVKGAINACEKALETPECNTHPKAPHGFNRNASHSAGRYVCECEGWQLEWQGLSDDEIGKIMQETHEGFSPDHDSWRFARAIEQALKEKNNA
jgi:dienelactone hydrolase